LLVEIRNCKDKKLELMRQKRRLIEEYNRRLEAAMELLERREQLRAFARRDQ
jgi:hypothetical protein